MKGRIATTASILKIMVLPALNLATGLIGEEIIQDSRDLEASETKDAIKNKTAILASTVNAFAITYSGAELLAQLIQLGIWRKLSYSNQIAIASILVVAGAGATYSFVAFGNEHNIFSASLTAAFSVFAMNATSRLSQALSNYIDKEKEEEELPLLTFYSKG